MANKRLNALDTQSARLTDLLIAVDRASGFTEVKKITAALLSPIISEETTGVISNRATSLMRFNDGAGNEYKCAVNSIYTLINELSEPPVSIVDGSLFRIDITPNGNEGKKSMLQLATYVIATTGFSTAVSAIITALEESYTQEIHYSGTGYGTLRLRRFWKIVTGEFIVGGVDSPGVDLVLTTETLGTGFRPSENLMFTRPSFLGSEENHYVINTDGSMYFKIDFQETGEPGSYPNIPIAYAIN